MASCMRLFWYMEASLESISELLIASHQASLTIEASQALIRLIHARLILVVHRLSLFTRGSPNHHLSSVSHTITYRFPLHVH